MAQKTPELQKTELVITTQTFLKTVGLVVGTVLVLAILRITAQSLVIIFVAFFLALALNAPVSFVSRHLPGKARGSRAFGTSIAFLIVVVLLGAFIASFVPPLVKQTQTLIDATPSLIQDVRDQRGPVGEIVRKYNLQDEVQDLSKEVSGRVKSGAGAAFSTIQQIGASAVTLLTVLVLAFMMLVEGPRRMQFLLELVPDKNKSVAKSLADDMYRVVKGYVNGQVTLAALAAIAVSPILFIMDVSYPIGLTAVVFICGLIPMVGATIGAIIVSFVALFNSPTAALIVLIYYITYQQIENYLIQPRIQANSTNMSPLIVFASVVIGVSFSGLLGGLLAIPIAGCIRVALLEYLRRRRTVTSPLVQAEIDEAIGKTK